MKKILKSILTIALVTTVVVGASQAFFSDTETSAGNTLDAGAIDLKIDNDSWYNGEWQDGMSWELDELAGHLFFNYYDLKPGDWGEDTISLHVYDNDAYICADVTLTSSEENDITEPESKLNDDGETGELAKEINFIWWADDGDNVLETKEEGSVVWSNLGDAWLNQAHTIALADSQVNIWNPGKGPGPVTGGENYFIGKAWCYGELAMVPVPGDEGINPGENSGIHCNGEPVTNISQTDSATLDVSFTAVQSRHNEGFVCGSNRTVLRLENKTAGYVPILGDGMYGTLEFKSSYPTFLYSLNVYGLQPGVEYILHYYADPWGGVNGFQIGSPFATDGSGNANVTGNVDLNADLPIVADDNYPSAKLWVIPSSDWGGTGTGMTAWNQTQYLWEWNLVTYDDTDTP